MTIAVRFESRGGNTRAVALEIARLTGVKAERTTVPLDGSVDTLYLGGGVLFNSPVKALKNFAKSLDAKQIKKIVPFGTSEFSHATVNYLTKVAKEKGIEVEEALYVKMGYQGFSLFAPAGGDLTMAQLEKIDNFIRKQEGK